jgi:hypothetical protein
MGCNHLTSRPVAQDIRTRAELRSASDMNLRCTPPEQLLVKESKQKAFETSRLPEIEERYRPYMDCDRLRSLLDYVCHKKDRDLINHLTYSEADKDLIALVMTKVGVRARREDIALALSELNRTCAFLNVSGGLDTLRELLEGVNDDAGTKAVDEAIACSRMRKYSVVTGGAIVPKELAKSIDNIVIGYYRNSGMSENIDIRPALRLVTSMYLDKGPEAAFEAIRQLDGNRRLKAEFAARGIDVDRYKGGFTRTYCISMDKGTSDMYREMVAAKIVEVIDGLSILDVPKSAIAELRRGDDWETLRRGERLVAIHCEDAQARRELKNAIQTAKSTLGTLKNSSTLVRYYVCTDPLESLNMGEYFRNCLSLSRMHGVCNGWAAVVQTMDENKNVISVRAADGRYIGQNGTVLTDRGVLCTSFRQNSNLSQHDAWISYLKEYAGYLGQEVMIPTIFADGPMAATLERMLREGSIDKEERTVLIAPAHYASIYLEKLSLRRLEDSTIVIETPVYVLRPEEPSTQP